MSIADWPWFPFFHKDWLTDQELRGCSALARSLHVDLICTMYSMEPATGALKTAKGSIPDERIFKKLAGWTREEFDTALGELLEEKVLHRDDDGALFSRRVVRDIKQRETKSRAGRAGAAIRWGAKAKPMAPPIAKEIAKGVTPLCPLSSVSILGKGECEGGAGSGASQAEVDRIFEAHPKPIGSKPAKAAIAEALQSGDITAAALLERVQVFEADQTDKRGTPDWEFVPTAKTWFCEERWRDAPGGRGDSAQANELLDYVKGNDPWSKP
jgi:hypothetical protein